MRKEEVAAWVSQDQDYYECYGFNTSGVGVGGFNNSGPDGSEPDGVFVYISTHLVDVVVVQPPRRTFLPSPLIHRGFWEETTLERHGRDGGHGTERESAYNSSSIKRARWIKPLPKLIRHKGWTIASDQDNIYLIVYTPVTCCYMDAVADQLLEGPKRPCHNSQRQCPATLSSPNPLRLLSFCLVFKTSFIPTPFLPPPPLPTRK